jgi:hypothetical protein
MPDIKGQLIKNSYNYVLQSDLITGIVYRIGGSVAENPKFISGLTVNANFTYSNGSEVDGYVLTCDASGNATWGPVSASTPSSGVTSVTATNGISGNVTTGAIILVNTAPDQIVTISGGTGITTGGTYPNFTIVNSEPDRTVIITGGTNIQITGTYPDFGVNFTGTTGSNFTGGTVSGATNFTNGLTANTISSTTISGGSFYGNGSNLTNIPNIYNTNGSLNGERTISLSGSSLIFKSKSDNVRIDHKLGLIINNDDDLSTQFSVSTDDGRVSIGGPLVVNSGNITLNNLTPDNLVPYLLGLDASNSARTFDANYIYKSITGGTYSGTTLYLVTNSGNTIEISGFSTGGGSFTGGTVSGATNFTNGLTANTISATTYYNYPDTYVTGFTLDNDTIILSQNRVDQYSAFNISLSGYVTNNIFSSYTASTQSTINNKLDTSGFTAYTATTETTINNKLDISGFTAYTATTQPLILNSVTGGTFSGGTLYLINNSGTTIPISGFTTGGTLTTDTFVTGFTLSANTITLSQNRTDSYSSFTISLSAYTGSSVSGLTYYVSASTPNNVTLISGDRWFNTDTGVEVVWIDDGDSQQWIQPFSVPGPLSPDVGYYATTGITTGQTLTWDKTYWGISANTQVNLILPTTSSNDGYYLIIKDESGFCGNYRIRLTPSVGLIDGNNYVDMNINYMSLTCMVRNGNWYLI